MGGNWPGKRIRWHLLPPLESSGGPQDPPLLEALRGRSPVRYGSGPLPYGLYLNLFGKPLRICRLLFMPAYTVVVDQQGAEDQDVVRGIIPGVISGL